MAFARVVYICPYCARVEALAAFCFVVDMDTQRGKYGHRPRRVCFRLYVFAVRCAPAVLSFRSGGCSCIRRAVEALAVLLLLCSPRACAISSMTNYFYKMRGFPLFFRVK